MHDAAVAVACLKLKRAGGLSNKLSVVMEAYDVNVPLSTRLISDGSAIVFEEAFTVT